MKYFPAIPLFIVLTFLGTTANAEQFYGTATVSQIVRIYDGDTFYANIEGWPPIVGQRIGIRIAGIDTPELKTKNAAEKELATKAKIIASSILKNAKVIRLENIRRGKYFRIVADVFADDINVADILIQNRLGKPYDGGTKEQW